MKNILIFILLILPVLAEANNSLSVTLRNQTILSDKDVHCLTLRPKSVTFELTKSGRDIFSKTTSENIGKEMAISICGVEKFSPVIMQKIDSQTFTSAITKDEQFKCLQDSLIKKCK